MVGGCGAVGNARDGAVQGYRSLGRKSTTTRTRSNETMTGVILVPPTAAHASRLFFPEGQQS